MHLDEGQANADWPKLPKLAPGSRWLTAEQAEHVIREGTHAEFSQDNAVLNAVLIEFLREGTVLAAQQSDGTLVFTKAPGVK